MIAKALVCLAATLLGLYGAWCASALGRAIAIEKVSSYDELLTIMLTWFIVTAAVLCPILCWGALRVLKRISRGEKRFNLVLGNRQTIIAKILVCLAATLLGLYGARWVSTLARVIVLEMGNGYDELTMIMRAWFIVTAAVLCPILCWGALRVLKRILSKPP